MLSNFCCWMGLVFNCKNTNNFRIRNKSFKLLSLKSFCGFGLLRMLSLLCSLVGFGFGKNEWYVILKLMLNFLLRLNWMDFEWFANRGKCGNNHEKFVIQIMTLAFCTNVAIESFLLLIVYHAKFQNETTVCFFQILNL